ncbi:WD40 repeat-like protein [Cristinia sonorae]|uniref:WD repeat-containing protein JIP5 n=1 Tax=Cristinia sonorae TaxID=1940300 RepID=A0A8K0XNI7_9AGAR|nr:WD40 repeat-like protein [Cristinia sonorae]
MPNIPVGAQIFDLVFHPSESLVVTGLLTGDVKAFSYDEQGNHEERFSIRPSKRSCRGIAMNESGDKIWAVGKGKGVYTIDTATGMVSDTRKGAHDVAINRVKRLLPNMFCTGDDDGVIKLWDPRQPEALRAYTHHYDFISDFLWLEDKKHLVASSGDGTLSVLDVRSKKLEPFAQSEDQEDELLSLATIKGGQKVVVGTQLGILSVFNRKSGWGDCVDRIPGHPHSIDALCNVPSRYPNAQSTILTGSSDGLLRAVQLLPTKLLGVVADHGEFPIERIAVDQGGEGRWVGSVGHEEVLKLTDLKEVFEDDGDEEEEEEEDADEEGDEAKPEDNEEVKLENSEGKGRKADADSDEDEEEEEEEGDDSSDESVQESRKRKKKPEKDELQATRRKKGRNEIVTDPAFFADL